MNHDVQRKRQGIIRNTVAQIKDRKPGPSPWSRNMKETSQDDSHVSPWVKYQEREQAGTSTSASTVVAPLVAAAAVPPSCPYLGFTPKDNRSIAQGPLTPMHHLTPAPATKDWGILDPTSACMPTTIDPCATLIGNHHDMIQPPSRVIAHSNTGSMSTAADSTAAESAASAKSGTSTLSSQASAQASSITKSASPEEPLFTSTGRPARRATSNRNSVYAPDCDKHGNPLKKVKKAASSDRTPQKQAKDKESSVVRSNSTTAATVGTHADALATTRSGRAVTNPTDRHRSSDRDVKASMRETEKKTRLVINSEEDNDVEDGEDKRSDARPAGDTDNKKSMREGGQIDSAPSEQNITSTRTAEGHLKSAENAKRRAEPQASVEYDVDELDMLRRQGEDRDETSDKPRKSRAPQLRRPNVEALISPAPISKRRKTRELSEISDDVKETSARCVQNPVDTSEQLEKDLVVTLRDAGGKRSEDDAAKPTQSNLGEKENGVYPVKILAADLVAVQNRATRHSDSSGRDTSSHDTSSLRSSFSGKTLSSLLQQQRHRRPGLTRRSFVPPLHPNRQPAPPPRPPPPMSRKDRDALKREREARGEDGSDSDASEDDDDDDDKPRYDPFEEEIEGY